MTDSRRATPLGPKQAEEAIAAELAPFPSESRPLEQSIGEILREDVYPERDIPPFDRVCMDGIAVASLALRRGVRRFALQAVQAAGAPALELASGEHAIEVMTGAILPRGADCVIPLEQYDAADGWIALKAADVSAEPYRNVQRRGEDGRLGVPMLRTGARLRPPEIAVVASAGRSQVRVSRQPRLVVISTGDELVEPGEPIAAHQIRRSNAYAVIAALQRQGFRHVTNDHLRDDEAILRERLARHLATEDALILSGGISKGRFDLVPAVLRGLGVREVFHYVAQQPGRPMWFGVGPGRRPVFGLPGNPVATLVCLMRYAVPALAAAMGAERRPPERIALASPLTYSRAVTRFLPVALGFDALGRTCALPRPTNGPGDFLALTASDGFLELPARDTYPQGSLGDLYRW
jgi:molybdopterin molybdotransferase